MNFKKIIGSVAPFLGSLVGGPFGAMAGKALGGLLCGNENASQEEIENQLMNASPADLVKIKQIDSDYKQKLAQIGLDEKKIAALDRDSARNSAARKSRN